jgi:hypothetical protein
MDDDYSLHSVISDHAIGVYAILLKKLPTGAFLAFLKPVYQPRVCSSCDSSSAATANPFIALLAWVLASSTIFGSS